MLGQGYRPGGGGGGAGIHGHGDEEVGAEVHKEAVLAKAHQGAQGKGHAWGGVGIGAVKEDPTQGHQGEGGHTGQKGEAWGPEAFEGFNKETQARAQGGAVHEDKTQRLKGALASAPSHKEEMAKGGARTHRQQGTQDGDHPFRVMTSKTLVVDMGEPKELHIRIQTGVTGLGETTEVAHQGRPGRVQRGEQDGEQGGPREPGPPIAQEHMQDALAQGKHPVELEHTGESEFGQTGGLGGEGAVTQAEEDEDNTAAQHQHRAHPASVGEGEPHPTHGHKDREDKVEETHPIPRVVGEGFGERGGDQAGREHTHHQHDPARNIQGDNARALAVADGVLRFGVGGVSRCLSGALGPDSCQSLPPPLGRGRPGIARTRIGTGIGFCGGLLARRAKPSGCGGIRIGGAFRRGGLDGACRVRGWLIRRWGRLIPTSVHQF